MSRSEEFRLKNEVVFANYFKVMDSQKLLVDQNEKPDETQSENYSFLVVEA